MARRIVAALLTAAIVAALAPGLAGAADRLGRDEVSGSAKFDAGWHIWVNADSDGDGSDPHGWIGLDGNGVTVVADVICLAVVGSHAAIGAHVSASDGPLFPVGSYVIRYVSDNGPASGQPDQSTLLAATQVDAEACDAFGFPAVLPAASGNLVVKDR